MAVGSGLQPEAGEGDVNDLAVGGGDEPGAVEVVSVRVARVRERQRSGRLQNAAASCADTYAHTD